MSFSIEGDLVVQIPVAGESISQYSTSEPAEFYVDSIEGVYISKEGRLTLNTDVKTKSVTIYAVNDKGEKAQMNIQLIESWTKNFVEKDGTLMSIPKSEEMPKIGNDFYQFATKENTIWGIRLLVVLGTVIFIFLFSKWKKTRRKR